MAKSKALLNVLNLINAETESMPVEQQFLNDLKSSIEREDEKNKREPSKTYKPSSLHCIRNMYFQITGAKVEGDRAGSELIGICESGTDRHNRIQNAIDDMRKNGINCEYIDVGKYVEDNNIEDIRVVNKSGNETKLYNEKLNMSFLCDGIIKYKGEYYIIEIKTETSNKFWERNAVNEDHILQGTSYSLNLNIDKVIFLYECRDTCNKKAFMLNVTDEMKQDLVGKITDCDTYVSNLTVPPKPKDLSKKYCTYCNYADLCKRS